MSFIVHFLHGVPDVILECVYLYATDGFVFFLAFVDSDLFYYCTYTTTSVLHTTRWFFLVVSRT